MCYTRVEVSLIHIQAGEKVKSPLRIASLALGLALAFPLASPQTVQVAHAQQIQAPLDRTLAPGTTTIRYGGESLRFSTTVMIQVRLETLGNNRIRVRVSHRAGIEGRLPGETLQIFWEDWGNELYNGSPPPTSSPWDEILNTEGGFTEG